MIAFGSFKNDCMRRKIWTILTRFCKVTMAAFTDSLEGTSKALLTKGSIFPNFKIYKY